MYILYMSTLVVKSMLFTWIANSDVALLIYESYITILTYATNHVLAICNAIKLPRMHYTTETDIRDHICSICMPNECIRQIYKLIWYIWYDNMDARWRKFCRALCIPCYRRYIGNYDDYELCKDDVIALQN